VREVCFALDTWLAEHNIAQGLREQLAPRLQVIFPSDDLAYAAQRALNTEQSKILDYSGFSRRRFAGIRFEFVGPRIMVER
jgi:hypothetical protein